jgi:hypothetical protein
MELREPSSRVLALGRRASRGPVEELVAALLDRGGSGWRRKSWPSRLSVDPWNLTPRQGSGPGMAAHGAGANRRTGLALQATAGGFGRAVESRQRGAENREEGMGDRQG